MIKAIFMDIDNTLLDFNASAAKAMEMAFAMHKIPFEERFFYTFKQVNDGLWSQIEKGSLTRKRLHEIRFDLVFSQLGISYDGQAVERDFLESLNVCAVHIDGAERALKYLSKRYILCSASNAPAVQQHKRLDASGLGGYFAHKFISQEIGYDKPDARFFEACFKAIAPITPAQTALVGDSLTADIAGGKACGALTIWFNRFNESDKGFAPDYIITELKQLEDIL